MLFWSLLYILSLFWWFFFLSLVTIVTACFTSKRRLSRNRKLFIFSVGRILGPNIHKFCLMIARFTSRTIKKSIQIVVLFNHRMELAVMCVPNNLFQIHGKGKSCHRCLKIYLFPCSVRSIYKNSHKTKYSAFQHFIVIQWLSLSIFLWWRWVGIYCKLIAKKVINSVTRVFYLNFSHLTSNYML